MKNYLSTFLMVILFALPSFGQTVIDDFISEYKNDDKNYALTLPGWLIRTGMGYAIDDVEELDPQDRAALTALKKGIKKMRVLTIDEKNRSEFTSLTKLKKTAMEADRMEEYISIKDEGHVVNMLVTENKDAITSMVFLITADENDVVLKFFTDIAFDDFKQANLSFKKLESHD